MALSFLQQMKGPEASSSPTPTMPPSVLFLLLKRLSTLALYLKALVQIAASFKALSLITFAKATSPPSTELGNVSLMNLCNALFVQAFCSPSPCQK